MPPLLEKQIEAICELTQSALKSQLSFRVSFRAVAYLHEDAQENWREVEERLHNARYPVTGVGLKATPANLKCFNEQDGGFLHLEEALTSDDAVSELPSFPYKAASAAYAFTLLEGYGNKLVDIVNPGYLKERQAWHHAVHQEADLTKAADLEKAKKGFTKPFKCKPADIKLYAVQRLVDLKHERNAFIHEAEGSIDFEGFHGKILGTIVALHFLILPDEKELSAYPFCDYHGKWK